MSVGFIFTGNGIGLPTGCRKFNYLPGSISIDCRNLRLQKIPSVLPQGTAQLLLSGNDIAEVPRYAFWGCEYLAHLDISFNQISTLYNESFSGLVRLKELILNNNIINCTILDQAVFLPIANIEVLGIGRNDNNKSTDYNDALFENLSHLQHLSIDGPPNATFGPGFGHLKQLQTLNITGKIMYVTNKTLEIFRNSSLKELRFQGGHLTDVDKMSFGHLSQLTLLVLSFNPNLGFPNASKSWYGLQFTSIKSLDLTRAAPFDRDIIKVEEYFYHGLEKTKLETIILDGNNIVTIHAEFRNYVKNLKYLSIAYNRIVQVRLLMCDFYYMNELVEINANYQNRRLSEHANSVHHWLRSKHNTDYEHRIEQNKVNTLKTNVAIDIPITNAFKQILDDRCSHNLQPLPDDMPLYIGLPHKVEYVNLAGSLSVDVNFMPKTIFLGQTSVRYINYAENGINRLIGPIIFAHPPPGMLTIDLSSNMCYYVDPEAAAVSGGIFDKLLLSHNRLGEQLQTDDNGTVFAHFIHLVELDLSVNQIKSLPFHIFKAQSQLQHLNLSGNSLQFIKFNMNHMNNLTVLDLSRNLFTQLDLQARNQLDTLVNFPNCAKLKLHIYGNPLVCSCDNLHFLEWMNASKRKLEFVYEDMITCMFNGSLVSLSSLRSVILPHLALECHATMWLIASVSAFSVLIVTLAISVCAFRHRFEIKYLFYKLIWERKRFQEINHTQEPFMYDAFIAYTDSEYDFVRDQIIPQLEEGDNPLKLCLHFRDFAGGKVITNNIINATQNSRKIVILLSNEFINSEWCDFEFEMASMESLTRGEDLILPVIMDDLDELYRSGMPNTMRTLLRKTTYRIWPQHPQEREDFWLNLRGDIERPPERTLKCACGNTVKLN